MFGNVCGTGCQYQDQDGAGGWGLGGEAMGSSERNNDNYSFLGAAAGPRGAGPPQPRPSCNQGIK